MGLSEKWVPHSIHWFIIIVPYETKTIVVGSNPPFCDQKNLSPIKQKTIGDLVGKFIISRPKKLMELLWILVFHAWKKSTYLFMDQISVASWLPYVVKFHSWLPYVVITIYIRLMYSSWNITHHVFTFPWLNSPIHIPIHKETIYKF